MEVQASRNNRFTYAGLSLHFCLLIGYMAGWFKCIQSVTKISLSMMVPQCIALYAKKFMIFTNFFCIISSEFIGQRRKAIIIPCHVFIQKCKPLKLRLNCIILHQMIISFHIIMFQLRLQCKAQVPKVSSFSKFTAKFKFSCLLC